jgi:hypothetical protein
MIAMLMCGSLWRSNDRQDTPEVVKQGNKKVGRERTDERVFPADGDVGAPGKPTFEASWVVKMHPCLLSTPENVFPETSFGRKP